MLELKLFLLLVVANGAPILAARLLGSAGNYPLDSGVILSDGYPLFGKSKTWRGLISALIATPLAALLLGMMAFTGIIFAVFAMLGDLSSSFIKRRYGGKESTQWMLLDQLPEALFPLIAGHFLLGYSWQTAGIAGLFFLLVAIGLSPLLFVIGIRKRPY